MEAKEKLQEEESKKEESKKKASPSTIHEEGNQPEGRKQSNETGIEGGWRKSYNKTTDRRKSAELSGSKSTNTNKPRHQNEGQNRQKSVEHTSSSNSTEQHQQNARDKRQSYNRNASGGSRHFSQSTDQKAGNGRNNNKTRSMSTKAADQDGAEQEGENGHKKRMNRGSTTSNGKSGRMNSHSMNSNGESFEYDDMELDEPFSDSDDDSPRQVQKALPDHPQRPDPYLIRHSTTSRCCPKWGGPTMCLSCLQFFNLPEQIGKFAEHLLHEHHIVVEEVDLIVDPKRYIEHWRQRFAKEPVDKIFPKKVPKENDPLFGKVDYYYEMSERIPEDYGLRQRLAMRRLEEALSCQQREREEVAFSMQCIFCRYVARGNRSKLIHHLYMIHHLNLGSPDNLVFVGEYIEHLKEKLQRNECIYCEKTFSDRTVLMDHMRKRNHREVNPKNNYYDKFYIINYLELGKRWLDVLAEDFEDTMPTFVDSDDEEEEEAWHEWQEDNADEDQLRAVCLYCDHSGENIEEMIEHIKDMHTFDLLAYIQKEELDVYGRMKFLNFVRKQTFNNPEYRNRSRNSNSTSGVAKEGEDSSSKTSTPQSASSVVVPERTQWDMDDNLVPMFGNDHFPWMLESFLEGKQSTGEGALDGLLGAVRKSKSVENGELDKEQKEVVVKACLEDSKNNTIEGVVAEDFPQLTESCLTDQEMYKSLR